MVLDLAGQHLEAVQLGGERVADGSEVTALRPRDLPRRVRRGVRGTGLGRRQLVGEPPTALRNRVRERHDGPQVGEADTGWGAQVERDRKVDLTLDQELALEGERVEGHRHGSLDHVLDRHHPAVGVVALHRRDDLGNRGVGRSRARLEVGL